MKVDVGFHDPPGVPVQWDGAQHAQEIGFVALVALRPQKIRRLIRRDDLAGNERRDDCAAVGRPSDVTEGDAGIPAGQGIGVSRPVRIELAEGRPGVPLLTNPLLLEDRYDLVGVGPGVVATGVGIPQVERRALVDRP